MQVASLIARYLLGIIFLVFGFNGFLHFLPMGPMPPGTATQFLGALVASHYAAVIFLIQLLAAVLFLLNRYVPLALVLIAPVIFNIFFFHALMAPAGLPLALLVVILWMLVAWRFRSAFTGILQA